MRNATTEEIKELIKLESEFNNTFAKLKKIKTGPPK